MSPTWRIQCAAESRDDGQRCCLLAGHSGPHRHGRTEFWLVLLEGDEPRLRVETWRRRGSAMEGA